MSLSKLVTKYKHTVPQNSLVYLLHEHVGAWEPPRPRTHIHASELTKTGTSAFCPREWVLGDILSTSPSAQYLDLATALTYSIGRSQEEQVAQWFGDMERVMGNWRCQACHTLHRRCKRPKACHSCGGKRFEHVEMRFTSKTFGASSGVDLLVKLNEPHYRIVEIKTMAASMFKDLAAPLAEHRLRTNLYMRILEDSGDPLAEYVSTQRAKVLYIMKGQYGVKTASDKTGGDAFSPLREFDVDRNDADTEPLVKMARTVHDWRHNKSGVPDGICSHLMNKRAKACPVAQACFGGGYPPTVNWKSG